MFGFTILVWTNPRVTAGAFQGLLGRELRTNVMFANAPSHYELRRISHDQLNDQAFLS